MIYIKTVFFVIRQSNSILNFLFSLSSIFSLSRYRILWFYMKQNSFPWIKVFCLCKFCLFSYLLKLHLICHREHNDNQKYVARIFKICNHRIIHEWSLNLSLQSLLFLLFTNHYISNICLFGEKGTLFTKWDGQIVSLGLQRVYLRFRIKKRWTEEKFLNHSLKRHQKFKL